MSQETEPIMARVTTGHRKARAAEHRPASCRVALHREQGPRESLEDAVGALTLRLGDECITVLVGCDGVCTRNHGEVASEMGVWHMCLLLAAAFVRSGLGTRRAIAPDTVRRVLLEGVVGVNRAVVQRSTEDPALRGMASTIVCVVIHEGMLYCVWAGDSRCYLARSSQLEQITRDHRLHAEVNGLAGRRAADVLNAHAITQCLGNAKGFAADYVCRELRDGDLILLCTDGLPDALTDEEIAGRMAAWRAGDCSLDELPRRLAEDALDAGTSDNTSVICCAYESPSAVAMDSEMPTRTAAYPAALAASFTLSTETNHD